MSKKSKFIECIDDAFFSKVDVNEIDPEVVSFWEAFKATEEIEKPLFTENGKLVMNYLQSLEDTSVMLKAKDIANELGISSRTVSGAMRKLVSDGFVEKANDSPVLYMITEAVKNIVVE